MSAVFSRFIRVFWSVLCYCFYVSVAQVMCVRCINMREYLRLCVLCVVRTSLALSHTCCLTAARLHRVQEPLSVFTKPTSRVKSLLDKEDVKHLCLHITDYLFRCPWCRETDSEVTLRGGDNHDAERFVSADAPR